MKFTTAFTALAAATLAQADLVERSGSKLTQSVAASRLSAGGVGWTSSGGCSDKNNPTCTSFDGVYSGTVDGAITLKRACGCTVTITGGTETGHAGGTYRSVYAFHVCDDPFIQETVAERCIYLLVGLISHANGYKFDFAKNSGLNSYVTNSFTRIADRSDGYPQWQASSGNIYCDEGNHWDVTFY
ncbi:hypothetical protein F5Y14DRAFT_392717 [Nemania sp. NC0429]|nr:hypothetical protein F5Y14DRAFT_392717 [Nemania sp. NC0429]